MGICSQDVRDAPLDQRLGGTPLSCRGVQPEAPPRYLHADAAAQQRLQIIETLLDEWIALRVCEQDGHTLAVEVRDDAIGIANSRRQG